MSDGVLLTYKEQNKYDKYYALPSDEKMKIDDVVSMFMKELTTIKGSNLFDRNYGTSFMNDIASQLNIYKIEYMLDNNYKDTYAKYGIEKVVANDVSMNRATGFLDVHVKIFFHDLALEHYTSFLYNGAFTTNTIIEVD